MHEKLVWLVGKAGERLNGIQEVVGSIPIVSTKNKPVVINHRLVV